MTDELMVRRLVEQFLKEICINPRYDLIDVQSIVDCDGQSFKFWVKNHGSTIVEGQCYPHLYGEESHDSVIRIYLITCPRREPIADHYEAWFDGMCLTKKFHGDQVVPLAK